MIYGRKKIVYSLPKKYRSSTKLTRNDISKYERGVREPALGVLLKYARIAKLNVELLIYDQLDLPDAIRKAKAFRGRRH